MEGDTADSPLGSDSPSSSNAGFSSVMPVGLAARQHEPTLVARVLFVHIPKTAGMALHAALQIWATPERSIRFERGGVGDLRRLDELSDQELANQLLVSGHLSLQDFRKRLGNGWTAITVLRDPIDRAISLFSFVKTTPEHPWYETASEMDLDEFVAWESERPYSINQQCMFVCSKPDARLAFDALERDFALACTLDQLPNMVGRLQTLLDFPLHLAQENVSQNRIARSAVSEYTLRAIADSNREDVKLCQRVRGAQVIGQMAYWPQAGTRG